MSEYYFGNGTKFDLSHIKAGIAIDENNIFLKKYDKNNNSIFDASEVNSLKTDLKKYSGEDKVLDENESLSFFANVMNMSISSVKELFSKNNNNMVYGSFEFLYTAQAYDNAANNILSNAQMGMQIYYKAQGGSISKAWNSIKEFWNTEYAGDKVYRQLAGNMASGMLLKKAQTNGGITKKDYIETKIEFLKVLLGGETLKPDETAMIEKAVGKMTVGELEVLITTLKNAENNEYPQLVDNTLKDLASKAFTSNDSDGFSVISPNSIDGILQSETAKEPLSFEQVFQLEQGVEFDAKMVNKYAEQERKLKILVTINNRIAELTGNINEPLQALEELDATKDSPEKMEQAYNNLSNQIIKTLENLYGTNAGEKLKEYGYPNAAIKDGAINLRDNSNKYSALAELAHKIQNDLNSKIQTSIDGKSIEQCEKELSARYTMAYGEKNAVDLAEKFKTSQEAGVGYAKMLVTTAGAVPCIISGGALIPIGIGLAASAFGSAAVSYAEASTKDGGLTPEDREAIKSEIITGLALTAAGGAIGKTSAVIGQELMKQCPKLIAYIGEYGADAVMGLLTDLAITGEIDLQGEGIAQLINIAAGIHAAKKAKVHSAVSTTKINENHKYSFSDIFARDLSWNEVHDYVTNLAVKRGSNLSSEELQKISEALYKMKKENSPLYQDIQNSGILKLVEEGKISFDVLKDVCINASKNTRMSAALMEDCKKLSAGESIIREFSSNSDLNQVFKTTQKGEVVEIGSQLYINDGKSLVKVNMTKEKYLELFPPFKRFDINQNDNKNAGNCWYLETMHNLYQNPSTRVNILKLFRQEGNDIYIKLPNSKYEYKFPNGGVPKNKHDNTYYLSDSPKWVNMLEYVGAFTRRKNGNPSIEDRFEPDALKKAKIMTDDNVIDVSCYMFTHNINNHRSGMLSNLYSGTSEEALEMLTGKNATTVTYYIDNSDKYYGAASTKEHSKTRKTQHKEIKKLLQNLDGKIGYTVNIAVEGHAYAVTKIENGKVYVQDPYNTKLESYYTIDEITKMCDYIEITNLE